MDNTNSFTGNTNAYIHTTNNNAHILGDMTLHSLNGYPWYFQDGLIIDADKNVTVEAGAVLLVGAQQRINIPTTSHFIAVGTAQAPITIKGLRDETGYWSYIYVSSHTPGTKFDYCNISGGGISSGTPAEYGLIKYRNNSYVEIYNCNLSKSINSSIVCGYASASFNTHYNAFLKHSNVTFSEIEGNKFFMII
jgi:hypothetical protein